MAEPTFKGDEIPYIFPQEPKTIEELEESRKLYLTLFDMANHDKLIEYLDYFEGKEKEATEHEKLVESPAEKKVKTMMVIFWKGLIDDVKRRL